MLFSNGGRRNSAGPLAELARRIAAEEERTLASLDELKRIAYEMPTVLLAADMPLLGELLEHGWRAKRSLHSQVTTPDIDRALSLAKQAGAYGGKLTGAGLAGSLLFVCPPECRADLGAALATQGWRARRVDVDDSGVVCGRPAGGALSG
jgi:D-glycero-alpha-D-manno-heptose-7-phosphate kinase